jgi:hypothetical protein
MFALCGNEPATSGVVGEYSHHYATSAVKYVPTIGRIASRDMPVYNSDTLDYNYSVFVITLCGLSKRSDPEWSISTSQLWLGSAIDVYTN